MLLPVEAIVGIVGVTIAVPPMIYALKQLSTRFFTNAPEKADDVEALLGANSTTQAAVTVEMH
ncbi:hypothetical protein B5807_05591 [Epicoccum nigrum]|uniref:Uncharacterized protein n=1 Tax=Epicoccum nigrum TaxID=105696 RepID=A0A1Y2M066_EPING|nr:hypothetical protein B5807_05591 [Epicoccum nigrum]